MKNNIIVPKSLQSKIDAFDKKGWFYGKEMKKALESVSINKLEDALHRTLKYANRYNSHIGITGQYKKPVIELVEDVVYGSNKFEKAPQDIPHWENIGKDVSFTYSTVVSTSDKPFSISDIEEFIALNKNNKYYESGGWIKCAHCSK